VFPTDFEGAFCIVFLSYHEVLLNITSNWSSKGLAHLLFIIDIAKWFTIICFVGEGHFKIAKV